MLYVVANLHGDTSFLSRHLPSLPPSSSLPPTSPPLPLTHSHSHSLFTPEVILLGPDEEVQEQVDTVILKENCFLLGH